MKENFIIACATKNYVLVKNIIEEGSVDVNSVDSQGRTGLIYASANNYVEIVKFILSHPHVDTSIKDAYEKSSYDYAKQFQLKEIMFLLKMKKLKQKIYINGSR